MPPKSKTQKIILVANIATKKYKKFTLNELSTELKRLNELEKKQSMPANVIRINVIKELVEESKLCKNKPKTIPPFKSKKMKKEDEVRPVDKTVPQLKKKDTVSESKEARKLWDSVKDLNWKQNVKTKILTLFNEGSRIMKGKKYHIVTDATIKRGKLIIKYLFTRQRAEEVLERHKGESSEAEVINITTKPTTGTFTLPKN